MNKHLKFLIIIFIIIIICSHLYCAEKNENIRSSNFIKRTILILPFLNTNNVIEYNYLSEILNDTLKSELLKTEIFNFIVPVQMDKKIKELGLTKEELINVGNAKNLALKLQADVFVVGKYIIIENEIMIIIQAYDIFTGQLAISTNIKGNLGIDIFRVIEDASKDMADKMAQKLQMVKKSYFTEMSKLIRKEKMAQLKERFTQRMKIGIVLTTIGSSLFLIGIPLFIYDLAGYSNTLLNYKSNYENNQTTYNVYITSYNIFIGLFIGSITTFSTGIILNCVGIPLIIIKNKKENLSLNLEVNNGINFVFSYKF